MPKRAKVLGIAEQTVRDRNRGGSLWRLLLRKKKKSHEMRIQKSAPRGGDCFPTRFWQDKWNVYWRGLIPRSSERGSPAGEDEREHGSGGRVRRVLESRSSLRRLASPRRRREKGRREGKEGREGGRAGKENRETGAEITRPRGEVRNEKGHRLLNAHETTKRASSCRRCRGRRSDAFVRADASFCSCTKHVARY